MSVNEEDVLGPGTPNKKSKVQFFNSLKIFSLFTAI